MPAFIAQKRAPPARPLCFFRQTNINIYNAILHLQQTNKKHFPMHMREANRNSFHFPTVRHFFSTLSHIRQSKMRIFPNDMKLWKSQPRLLTNKKKIKRLFKWWFLFSNVRWGRWWRLRLWLLLYFWRKSTNNWFDVQIAQKWIGSLFSDDVIVGGCAAVVPILDR